MEYFIAQQFCCHNSYKLYNIFHSSLKLFYIHLSLNTSLLPLQSNVFASSKKHHRPTLMNDFYLVILWDFRMHINYKVLYVLKSKSLVWGNRIYTGESEIFCSMLQVWK